jgi:hypothetical protein
MSSKAVSINTVLEYVEKLDSDDQQYLSELLHKRLVDAKRAAIAKRARQAKENERKGRCKTGSVKELRSDLNG